MMGTLRLHTDREGVVWYGDDSTLATCSGLDPDEFVSGGIEFGEFSDIALLGCRENGYLIHSLHLARMFRAGLSIRLGSPAIVPREAHRADPLLVLQYLRQPPYRLAGQWHDLDQKDFCTYSMIANLGNSQTVTEVVRRISLVHPAWHALTFINNLELDTVCRLLCEIVDPRWYLHPGRPDRTTKLYSYLGLSPRNIRAWLSGSEPDRHFDRMRCATLAWYNPTGCTGTTAPGDFLWRCFDSQPDAVRGILRATQCFVSYLSAAWLAAISPRHPEANMELQMARFFADDETAAAFRNHMSRKKTV